MDESCTTAGFATHEIRKIIKRKRGNKEYQDHLERPLDLCPQCYKEFNHWLEYPIRYTEMYKKLNDPKLHKELGEALFEGFEKAKKEATE